MQRIFTKRELYKVMKIDPGWCGSVDWVPVWEPKGRRFNSPSGHMPGLQASSLAGGVWEATNRCISHTSMFKNLKKNERNLSDNTDEPWKYYARWKKSFTKDHTERDSVYTKCPEQAEVSSRLWRGEGGQRDTVNGYGISFGVLLEQVLTFDCVDIGTPLWIY